MVNLEEIKQPVEDEIKVFESKFKASMKSPVPLLNVITRYILKRKGKQIRPLLVMLSAKACGSINESTYVAASLIELLHTATLIHDDVVDESNLRRGFFSVNALWKNKIAVLVGDYLLSRGLLLALDNNEFTLLKIVSNATREMSEGELLQIEKARKLTVTEEVYFDIIRKKTASLISACCKSGAVSAGADEKLASRMAEFGEKIGMAFQLRDDLLDYSSNQKTGKPRAQDIKEKKMTLPVLYTLKQANGRKKTRFFRLLKRKKKNELALNRIIEEVNRSGGVDYTRQKLQQIHQEALTILNEIPENDARDSLKKLADFIISREG